MGASALGRLWSRIPPSGRLLFVLGPQRCHAQLVPLSQYPQCILSLDIRHLLPVRNATQCTVAIDDHGPEVIKLDALPAAHVELHGSTPGRWFGKRKYLLRRLLSGG